MLVLLMEEAVGFQSNSDMAKYSRNDWSVSYVKYFKSLYPHGLKNRAELLSVGFFNLWENRILSTHKFEAKRYWTVVSFFIKPLTQPF